MSDLRTKRTRASIRNAFLALRVKKPLEKITVKELAELAHINKATFYLHYRDIYDLSDQVEDEVLEESLRTLSLHESVLDDPARFVRALIDACEPHLEVIETVFSGGREAILPDKIEAKIKAHFYQQNPRLAEDLHTEVLLSYMIQGSYRAYVKHERHGALEVLSMVAEISHNLAQFYQAHPPAPQAAEPAT
ncbi:MAG: TetR/AcrR family transcriptional regulator [Oscillospiraceae bacterium]